MELSPHRSPTLRFLGRGPAAGEIGSAYGGMRRQGRSKAPTGPWIGCGEAPKRRFGDTSAGPTMAGLVVWSAGRLYAAARARRFETETKSSCQG